VIGTTADQGDLEPARERELDIVTVSLRIKERLVHGAKGPDLDQVRTGTGGQERP